MRDMEWQVSNKELSQKLKELRVKQESLWWWVPYFKGDFKNHYISKWKIEQEPNSEGYSAFTVAELGEIIKKRKNGYNLTWWTGKEWTTVLAEITIEADTEADCRAKMLIWLMENKKINP